MGELDALFASNRAWAHAMKQSDAGFFERLSRQQAPQFLWIGCSDSRVPANQIVGLAPGELFVQRNVAISPCSIWHVRCRDCFTTCTLR